MITTTTTPTAATTQEAKPQRRYDIDWLRVLAVFLLFPFHTARIFDTFFPWYVKNVDLSGALTYFTFYVHPWHMPLLFLLAGASTWFALGFRSGGQYTKERFIRLLIPFIFALLVIVPPQSYFGLLGHTGFAGSYLDWYPNFFSINAADMDGYFMGGFTPAHLWFILYLFIFSLLALPLFLYLRRRDSGKRLIGWIAAFCSIPGMIFLLAIPLYVMVRLIDFSPNPLYYITFFIYGFILVADSRFDAAIDRHKMVALVLGPILYIFGAYFQVFRSFPKGIPAWLIDVYINGFAPWFFLIAILGYGRKFLNFSSQFLRYTAEASYPAYILHQTVIVIIGFYVVQWSTGIAIKYMTILVAAVAVTMIIYDLLIKRTNVTRFLFGMRLKKKPAKEPVAQSGETGE
ncbi:acyltransferase family protein [Chloroflexota bacterium]